MLEMSHKNLNFWLPLRKQKLFPHQAHMLSRRDPAAAPLGNAVWPGEPVSW